MRIHLDPLGGTGQDKRVQGTFKRPVAVDPAGGVARIKKTAQVLAAIFDRFDITIIIQKINAGDF